MKFLSKITKYYMDNLEGKYGVPAGSSLSDIEALEVYFGKPLPEAYKEYLRWMGNDYNGVFRGSDWFCRDVIENTEYLLDILSDNKVTYKPTAPCAFFCHQGYMIAWFELKNGEDDPECLYFSESEPTNLVHYDSFSSFLEKELKGIQAL